MINDFLLYALLAGIGIALLCGPLGSFVIWRRMAYFGDTLSHGALLGVAMGLWLNINLTFAVLLMAVLMAVALLLFTKKSDISSDTILGILAHTSLSLGLVAVALMDNVRVDLMGYLFGDLLAVTPTDLVWIYLGGAVILGLLFYFWDQLLAMTINAEMAKVEGVKVQWLQLLLVLMLAVVIALAMKIVGVLIISALLIIPPATARTFSKTPEQMAIFAAIIGCIAVALGLSLSWFYNTPAGPSVVVASAGLFIISRLKELK